VVLALAGTFAGRPKAVEANVDQTSAAERAINPDSTPTESKNAWRRQLR
jgi:hypothetical protein